MKTRSGEIKDRICPWATHVNRPKDVAIYEQLFWDPPEDQVKYINKYVDYVYIIIFVRRLNRE